MIQCLVKKIKVSIVYYCFCNKEGDIRNTCVLAHLCIGNTGQINQKLKRSVTYTGAQRKGTARSGTRNWLGGIRKE